MKTVKILGQLLTETESEFERQIEKFINDGWNVIGFSHYANNHYMKVLLVKEEKQP